MKKAILMVAGTAVQKYMMQLAKEQEILMNIADMAIETFNAESLLLRVKKLTMKNGADSSKTYNAILKVFMNDAVERLNLAGKNAIASMTEGDEQRLILMGLKRFVKITPVNTRDLRRAIAKELIEANKYCF